MILRPIKNVIVLGASGNIGPAIVSALQAHPAGFVVSVTTRDRSTVSFSASVRVFETDYSQASLKQALEGQNAVISTLNARKADLQKTAIDVAIENGIIRFLPTEFGVDTDHPDLVKYLPFAAAKAEVIQYLKSKQEQISWTSVIVGSFFDWSLAIPGSMGWNIPECKATIYDGGNVSFEVTNTSQIAKAVAAILSPEHQAETANQYVYVNSFTLLKPAAR